MTGESSGSPAMASSDSQFVTPAFSHSSARMRSMNSRSRFIRPTASSIRFQIKSCGALSSPAAHAAANGESNQKKWLGGARPQAAYISRTDDSACFRSAGSVETSQESQFARLFKLGQPHGLSIRSACFSQKLPTLPRSTVIEALGSVNVVCEFAVTTVATGGWSGSAWLFGPSLIHTYCSLPKVASVTGPLKEISRFLAES